MLSITSQGDQVHITHGEQSADFDTAVSGISKDVVESMLTSSKDQLFVRWSRIPTRVALLHVYDCLAAAGINVQPNKSEALSAWDDMHVVSISSVASPQAEEPTWVQPGRAMVLDEGFTPLLKMDGDAYINHVGAICTALQFPIADFERLHVGIASELFQRWSQDMGGDLAGLRPQVFVRSYKRHGVISPLLVWYQIHEQEVVCLLQEFLHVRFPHIPKAVVWYWQLLPYHANLHNIGRYFDAEEILPSLDKLLKFASSDRKQGKVNPADVERRGMQPSDRMAIDYGNGLCAMWLGNDVFFFVEVSAQDQINPLRNVRAPINHSEIPTWAMDLLSETNPGVDRFSLARNVDSFLQRMDSSASRAVRLLRSVNWSAIPLVWRPLFMKNMNVTVSARQASEAQVRLIKGISPEGEAAEIVAEAIDLLHRMTGV